MYVCMYLARGRGTGVPCISFTKFQIFTSVPKKPALCGCAYRTRTVRVRPALKSWIPWALNTLGNTQKKFFFRIFLYFLKDFLTHSDF